MKVQNQFPNGSKRQKVFDLLADGKVHKLSEAEAIGGSSTVESVIRAGYKSGAWSVLVSGDTIQMVAGGEAPVHKTPRPPELSDEAIEEQINSKFATLDLLAKGVAAGAFRSLIVSGNPGTGKTYTLESILKDAHHAQEIMFSHVKGIVRATGLYRLLWEHREKKSVLLLDDADSVYSDPDALNLLKGALDTTKNRRISWLSEKDLKDEVGEAIPKSFDFDGAVVFITNLDFEVAIQGKSKVAAHLEALMSRSFYLDLNLATTRELMIRIRSVIASSDILADLKKAEQTVVIKYLETNHNKLRELSLRSVTKLGMLFKASGSDVVAFTQLANATMLAGTA
jgi:hypothetical protein